MAPQSSRARTRYHSKLQNTVSHWFLQGFQLRVRNNTSAKRTTTNIFTVGFCNDLDSCRWFHTLLHISPNLYLCKRFTRFCNKCLPLQQFLQWICTCLGPGPRDACKYGDMVTRPPAPPWPPLQNTKNGLWPQISQNGSSYLVPDLVPVSNWESEGFLRKGPHVKKRRSPIMKPFIAVMFTMVSTCPNKLKHSQIHRTRITSRWFYKDFSNFQKENSKTCITRSYVALLFTMVSPCPNKPKHPPSNQEHVL